MSLVVKYSESPVKLMENQKLVEIQFPNTATEIIGLKTDNLTKIDVSKCSKDFVNTVKSIYQDKSNNSGENVQIINPNMIIEYTASEKLDETTSNSSYGLHTTAFNATMTSHTFENEKGAITFNGDVTSIGYNAFRGCTGLTSITIPDSVVSIGAYAFQNCERLTSIEIPDSVTSIDVDAFSNCYGLTSMVVNSGNTIFDSRNNCNAIIKTSTNELIAGCNNTIIPDSVTSIYQNTFRGCLGLTSINIPDGVTSIGYGAFQNCSELTSIIIPDSVTSIGGYAFNGCSKLTSVTLGNGICSKEYPNSNSGLKAIFGNQVAEYIIPDSVTSIGNYAFYGCSGLTSITIPDSVTKIGRSAFYGCRGLTSMTIPNSVTSIGNYAFKGCSGLTSITCNPVTPPILGSSAIPSTVVNIYVPSASVDAYKTASRWKSFASIITAIV